MVRETWKGIDEQVRTELSSKRRRRRRGKRRRRIGVRWLGSEKHGRELMSRPEQS